MPVSKPCWVERMAEEHRFEMNRQIMDGMGRRTESNGVDSVQSIYIPKTINFHLLYH